MIQKKTSKRLSKRLSTEARKSRLDTLDYNKKSFKSCFFVCFIGTPEHRRPGLLY